MKSRREEEIRREVIVFVVGRLLVDFLFVAKYYEHINSKLQRSFVEKMTLNRR